MIALKNVLISDDVLASYFACDLNACHGACCWEGDFGAPLLDEEIEILHSIKHKLLPYLSSASKAALEREVSSSYQDGDFEGTPLHQDGSCVYLAKGEDGIARCGIEMAHRAGDIDFIKPVSCQLYPIRVEDLKVGLALNYDRWHICSAACSKGKTEKIRLVDFVKDGLIRRFGLDFFNELQAIVGDESQWK